MRIESDSSDRDRSIEIWLTIISIDSKGILKQEQSVSNSPTSTDFRFILHQRQAIAKAERVLVLSAV